MDDAQTEDVVPRPFRSSEMVFQARIGKNLRKQAEDWILDYYGERCEDFHLGCLVCQVWRAWDDLFGELENGS
jgi:hypothetical protein